MKKIAKIIWLTGLSGSGKSTISNYLTKILKKKKFKVLKVDGDIFRKNSKNKNKFTVENITINNLKIIDYLKKKLNKYDFLLVSVISPLKKTRYLAKNIFKKNYFEVNVYCNLNTLIKRDTKGLYKKALEKKINDLIGFRSKIKYQKSSYSVIKVNTDKLSIFKSAQKILKIVKNENKKI
tara:strand:- start:701 stop:1240 length:540 start_codon:yes stop_codon:yes gene_type:complete